MLYIPDAGSHAGHAYIHIRPIFSTAGFAYGYNYKKSKPKQMERFGNVAVFFELLNKFRNIVYPRIIQEQSAGKRYNKFVFKGQPFNHTVKQEDFNE